MNKTKIPWVKNHDGTQGYTSNPARGKCPVDCSYCYVKPLRRRYGWSERLTYHKEELLAIHKRKKPAGIFVGSVMELFHEATIGVMPDILETIKDCPQHRFYLLTKQPQNLAKFSPFPDNCWVGVSVTNQLMLSDALLRLIGVDAKVKFLSFEPLLGEINVSFNGVGEIGFPNGELQWVIIGSQTKPTVFPKIEWVSEIVQACDKAKIPVFLKGNLEPLWTLENSREPFFKFHRPSPGATEIGKLRQEMPDVKAIH